jgi:hypothetical protein
VGTADGLRKALGSSTAVTVVAALDGEDPCAQGCPEALSERFAEKWIGVGYVVDEFANPTFSGGDASFGCCKKQMRDAADHMTVLGEVLGFREDWEHSSLVHCRSSCCLTVHLDQQIWTAA